MSKIPAPQPTGPIDDLIQTLRQLRISQIRKQMAEDLVKNPSRLAQLTTFILAALEQQNGE